MHVVRWHGTATLVEELGDDLSLPTPLCVDNQGSIYLAINPVTDRHLKHPELRYYFICEYYKDGKVTIYYVWTNDQLANIFTKNVSFAKINKFLEHAGLQPHCTS